jgi:hypothetical protein
MPDLFSKFLQPEKAQAQPEKIRPDPQYYIYLPNDGLPNDGSHNDISPNNILPKNQKQRFA